MSDRSVAQESYTAGPATWAPALWPCEHCGRETSAHFSAEYPDRIIDARLLPNARICSAPLCRHATPFYE